MKSIIALIICLLSLQMNAQIVNPCFEEWDTIELYNRTTVVPKYWHTDLSALGTIYKSNDAFKGNSALLLFGTYASNDFPVTARIQQKIRIPYGLDSISFYLKTDISSFLPVTRDFYGFGLARDTFNWFTNFNQFLEYHQSFRDSIEEYSRFSIQIDSAIWNQEIYLTFYCSPIDWGAYGFIFIDHIELHGDLETNTNNHTFQPLKIFPNPVEDWIVIQDHPSEVVETRIFNSLGQLVYKGGKSTSIYIGNLNSGTYYLSLYSKNGVIINKTAVIKK